VAAVPVPFDFLAPAPGSTPDSLGRLEPGARYAAGQLTGTQIGLNPFNTTIPLGGGIVVSRPIMAAGLNAFSLNLLSTNLMLLGFVSPCDPRTSADLMGLGDLVTNGLQLFDEGAGSLPPYDFGSRSVWAGGIGLGLVWHTFTLTLFNYDLINDAQLQFCELWGNVSPSQ